MVGQRQKMQTPRCHSSNNAFFSTKPYSKVISEFTDFSSGAITETSYLIVSFQAVMFITCSIQIIIDIIKLLSSKLSSQQIAALLLICIFLFKKLRFTFIKIYHYRTNNKLYINDLSQTLNECGLIKSNRSASKNNFLAYYH